MTDAGSEHAPRPTSGPPAAPQPLFAPGERLPWVLRPPKRESDPRQHDREHDRVAALEARRAALLVIPSVGLGWLLVALFAGEDALRIVTIAALVVCVALGVRAAITTQRFRQRWLDPDAVPPPPIWVTLVTVAAAVFSVVAIANLVADVKADRPAAHAIIFTAAGLALVGLGSFAHLSGGRSVGAALRE